MKKKVLATVIMACGVLIAAAGGNSLVQAKEKIVFENVEKNKVSLIKGEKFQLEVDEKKLDDESEILWKSSNPKVVRVSKKGNLKAKSKGKAKITAELKESGRKKKIKVSVRQFVKIKKIQWQTKKDDMFVDDVLQLDTKVSPKKNDDEILWSSSAKEIATVDKEGNITGHKEGTVTIKAKAKKGKKQIKKKIHVRKNEVTSLKFTQTKPVVGLSQTYVTEVKINPSYVTDDKLVYKSTNPAVVTVDANGVLTGKSTGKAEIKASWYKNPAVSATCNVTVSRVQGQLTKAMLDKLDLKRVSNLMIVAHPDDETLFGGAHLIAGDYLVVCMTNGSDPVRSRDFNEAMDIAQVERIILSHPDNTKDKEQYYWDYDQLSVQSDIRLLLNYKKWDTVVTHNPEGEYGHYHHKRVNRYTTNLYKEKPDVCKRFMYFGKYYKPEQMTPVVLSTLAKTNDELFDIKVKMLEEYESKHWTCFTWLWHIQPYENWVYYEDWK